jgi:hypothetical protein
LTCPSTSADPRALARVLSGFPSRVIVQPVTAPEPGTYLHAKFILARTAGEDIVLSGSANMSLSALCSTADTGNVELGSLLVGPPGTFDYLLDGLTAGPPASDLTALRIALRPDDGPQPGLVILRSARWQAGVLTVTADRDLPTPENVRLQVGDITAGDLVPQTDGAVAVFHLASTTAGQALERAVPVTLLLGDGHDNWTATTPVWPYHVDVLRGRLARPADHDVLRCLACLSRAPEPEARPRSRGSVGGPAGRAKPVRAENLSPPLTWFLVRTGSAFWERVCAALDIVRGPERKPSRPLE